MRASVAGREMTMPLRKLRTCEHVIADLGVNYVGAEAPLRGGSVHAFTAIMATI